MDQKKVSILIADDDKNARLILADIVREMGFYADEASDGLETLQMLSGNMFDILLLDLKMPKLDGMHVLKRLRTKRLKPEVIVVTSHPDVAYAVEAIKLGAYDFVSRDDVESRLEVSIRNALAKRKLEKENKSLKDELLAQQEMLGESQPMQELREKIAKVAPTDCTVLITGESGIGKELVARQIHQLSLRREKPLITINCSALPETLLESELFGHVKGAFTSATVNKKGKFEIADKGTLFLDEIGDMSLNAQSKLLRVLETGDIQKVGAAQSINVDVRVIAATNKDLKKAVKDKNFRQDLYYRINVITISVPPLRERKEDIPLLANYYLNYFSRNTEISEKRFSERAMELLINYAWPGNVRELKNLMNRLAIFSSSEIINEWELSQYWEIKELANFDSGNIPSNLTLEQARRIFETHYIRRTLIKCKGNITKTAQLLNLNRSYLHEKMKELGVREL